MKDETCFEDDMEFRPSDVKLLLLNTERYRDFLSDVPHYEIEDLSAAPYLNDDGFRFCITKNLAARNGLTPSEILKIGNQNMQMEPFLIMPMQKAIGMLDEDNPDAWLNNAPDEMLLVTNDMTMYGAAAILSQPVMQDVKDQLGGDFIILPSSMHEVICLRDTGKYDPSDLRSIVTSVNSGYVTKEDFLSDSIYRCDGKMISLIPDKLKIESSSEPLILDSGIKLTF